MANPSKQKGTAWETKLVRRLSSVFPLVERRALRGVNDLGDFANCNAWVIEAKNQKSWRLHEWMRSLRKKAHGAPYVLLATRDARSDRPLAILDLDEFLILLDAYEKSLKYAFTEVSI